MTGIGSGATHDPMMLVGREREQAVLRDHLAAALAGQGSLVLIGGEAGIGKTALTEALCREAAEAGALVLVGRCYDLTETPPYGPWVHLFADYHQTEGLPPLPASFARPGTVGEVTGQDALFQQVLAFFIALTAVRSIVVVLDDVHWADPASLDLLRFLARSLSTLPMQVVALYRADELTRHHPLYALLPVLERESGAHRLNLRQITPAAIRSLVTARYPLTPADTERLATYLVTRAEGNTFFTLQLLRALEEEEALRRTDDGWLVGNLERVRLPLALRQVLDARVARFGEETQRLLCVAAVLGQEIPFTVWAAVAGVSEEALLTTVDEMGGAHLIEEMPDGTAVRFVHALVREALYERLSPARRRLVHRRAGEVLAERPNADPDAVAMHFRQAVDERATAWLVKTGERAQQAYAWETAAQRYEGALALLEGRDERAGECGWLRYRIARLRRFSNPRQGVEYLAEAERLAESVGDRALAAAARFSHGLCLAYDDDFAAGRATMAQGADALEALSPADLAKLDLLPDRDGTPTIANCRGMLVFSLALAGSLAESVAMGDGMREAIPARSPLSELGASHYGDRHAGLGTAYASLGLPAEARRAFSAARACFRAVGHYTTLGTAGSLEAFLVSLPYYPEQVAENRRLAAEVESAWNRAGAAAAELAFLPLHYLHGAWSDLRAIVLEIEHGKEDVRSLAFGITGQLAREEGDRAAAWEQIRSVLPEGSATEPGCRLFHVVLPIQRLAATLALDANDLTMAFAWIEAHDRWLAWSGAVLGQSEGHALWAAYHRAAGNAAQANARAERALAHATEPHQPLALLAAHRLLGALDTDARRFGDAATHLSASLALADRCQAPYERALTLLGFAEFHAAMRNEAEARVALDEARALCTPLGAQPALARADDIAARLATVSTSPPVYPAGLSMREVEVLRLVATGQTNREIADALFLSEHTVRVHVRNILTKTDTANRTEAAAFALRHGLA